MKVEKFRNYLLSKGLAKINQASYYLMWVGDFLQFCNLETRQDFSDQHVEAFIQSLDKKKQQWQLDQAREAISLFRFWRGNKRHAACSKPERDSDWAEAAESMRRMIRLKQLSFRTEQTYLRWLRFFCGFVRPALPSELGDLHNKGVKSTLDSYYKSIRSNGRPHYC